MALVKLGGGVAGISGSIGGTTFARNRFGSYARNRTIPVNPNTSRQSAVRAIMANISQYWNSTLSDAQRIAWATYAAAVPWINRIGETVYLTGFNMFIRTNMVRQAIDLTILDDAPTTLAQAETPVVSNLVVDSVGQTIDVDCDDSQAWANENNAYIIGYQGRAVNASRNFYGGIQRYAGKLGGDIVTPIAEFSIDPPVYTIVAGQKTFMDYRIIRADGRVSGPVRISAVSV